ncbi:murein transglycosylase [Leptolyngbya sp. 'hensonii']|uniref:murein transglycosylase A n=1 Tax=Leptolyngbya sp. 'hensonii' TaxID=1922337 RepID=UPI00094F7BA8|nr:murein transglycosylase A [Leptolyngbya sp. 'hensonii']OLP16859.1 murein transglycosylase [Leptolyngbya sp. 'hensonii']
MMVNIASRVVALLVTGGTIAASAPPPPMPLLPIPLDRLSAQVGIDRQIFGERGTEAPKRDRANLLLAIDHSLRYLQTPKAAAAYRQYAVQEITLDRVKRSLERFRELVQATKTPAELQVAVRREFIFYRAVGKDQRGTVAFTGYFEPVYTASRVPTPDYRYPLYQVPPDLAQWPKPHPTRLELEGADGLQSSKGRLKNLELVWLRDRFQAFLVQVQGSAQLQLPDGSRMTVGYAGRTEQPYTGVGRQLVQDGKLKLEELTLPNVIRYFQTHPAEMDVYLPRNRSFVFFTETKGAPATGSLGVPVTAERSIATDKSIMPPGALALIDTRLPYRLPNGKLGLRPVNRFVLDQDTGGAIVGPGRVDIFMGTGPEAGDRAGLINVTGQLYYLLLNEPKKSGR